MWAKCACFHQMKKFILCRKLRLPQCHRIWRKFKKLRPADKTSMHFHAGPDWFIIVRKNIWWCWWIFLVKAWNILREFCPDFPPILQSEQVAASWGKSEPVCRLQLTDSTENHVVYDGHRLWFYPVGWYQTCLIFSADFRTHMFSSVICLLATRSTFLREFVVIGTTLKSGSVWSSVA